VDNVATVSDCAQLCRNSATCKFFHYVGFQNWPQRCYLNPASQIVEGSFYQNRQGAWRDEADSYGWVCERCPLGSYCPHITALAISCGIGKSTTTDGSTASSACVCDAGYYISGASCIICPQGEYCASKNSATQTNCPAGAYS
jgi:hypothetical protein